MMRRFPWFPKEIEVTTMEQSERGAMKQNIFSFSVRENEIALIQNYSYNATESSNY